MLWYLADNLGTVRDLAKATVDGSGNVTDVVIEEHYSYDSFGNVLTGDTSKTRYLYTGREFDADTGLQYNRRRWYDPATGGWLSEDPIGFAAGDSNLSRYVGNGVTNATDPTGFILVAIDGTGSREFAASPEGFDVVTGRRRSHVRNFANDYVAREGERVLYLHGPTGRGGGLGLDTCSIYDQALDELLSTLGDNPDEEINLVGHSRGGHIAIELARELQRRGYQVNFLGLYDAVDMTPLFGYWSQKIPNNVENATHAMGDPELGSRWFFNTVDGGAENESGYEQRLYWCTHGGMGGAPWFGDHPDGIVQSVDERNSEAVDLWMRERAGQAGIEFSVDGAPTRELSYSIWGQFLDVIDQILDWRPW